MRTADFRSLFKDMRPRRRMWVLSDSYEVLAAFITGCDSATNGQLLEGFQEWVVDQIPDITRSNLAWPVVVAARHWPEVLKNDRSIGDLPPELNETVAEDLFALLDSFLGEREGATVQQ